MTVRLEALAVVREQLETATAAKKCHTCGCLHQTVTALRGTGLASELAAIFDAAEAAFEPKRYDCLGCAVCFPAVAANAFAEAFPHAAGGLDLCPTEAPGERVGWPPLPGDYQVVRYRASVAVCTLNNEALTARLAELAPEGLSIVGTMHTENLGIERVIQNVLANPNIRHLLLCGDDTQQAIGHLPGQSLASLLAHGIDDRGKIRDAKGKRPILKNVTSEQVVAFCRQAGLISMIGVTDEATILQAIAQAHARRLPASTESAPSTPSVATIQTQEPRRLVPDPSGFFVVYPERTSKTLVLEHYSTDGGLDCILEGRTPAALYAEVVTRSLISRLDHAAYLGRELARAEACLSTGEPYVQDRAAGEIAQPSLAAGCGCTTGCGEPP